MMTGEGKVVCVTGASGYIASWLVKFLLLRGYTVHATLRSLDDPKKMEHLVALEGAKERLHFFKADLKQERSFDSSINGCDGVFHVASPCSFTVTDPQSDLLDPAIKGTVNVLESCAKYPTVKRVVLTSSIAAVIVNGWPRTPEVVIDETWVSDPEFCRREKMWYQLAKTLAEEAAWKLAIEKGIDLVVMNPTLVIGPLLQPTLNLSNSIIFNLIGAKTFPNSTTSWVHVKDVAKAHIEAFEVQSANGRYCLVGSVAHYSETVQILRDLYPNLPLPHKCVDDKPYASKWKYSLAKATSLGVDFTPLEECLHDTIKSFKDMKLIEL